MLHESDNRRGWPDKQVDLYKRVGALIRTARLEAHLTQDQVAQSIGLTRTSLTNIEKGRQKLLLHTLMDVAGTINVPIESLLPRTINPSAPQDLKLPADLRVPEREWIKKTAAEPYENSPSPNQTVDGKSLKRTSSVESASRRRGARS